MILEIQVPTWNKHNNVAWLNQSMGSQSSQMRIRKKWTMRASTSQLSCFKKQMWVIAITWLPLSSYVVVVVRKRLYFNLLLWNHWVNIGTKLGKNVQTKDYKIGICCFPAKPASLRIKCKDWLTRNQDNVSGWSDMSIRGLFFQCASAIKNQLSVLV